MPRGLAVLGREKGLHKIPSHGRPNGPAAHAKDVHVIVLDTLPGRKVVVNQRSARAWNFVRADRCANAASADGEPAFHLAGYHSPCQRDNEIGIVVVRAWLEGTEVDDFVACLT